MINGLVNFYIDLNIALLAAFAVWVVTRFFLARVGYRFSFTAEQYLIFAFMGIALLGPLCARFFAYVLPANFNLTDWLVAWYLGGGLQMSARDFQSVIGAKGAFVEQISRPNNVITLVFTVLMVSGFGFFLLRLCRSIFSLSNILSNSYSIHRIGRVHIVASDRINVPFTTLGWRGFYVVVPIDMLSHAGQMRIAIAHEMQHIRHGDVAWEYMWSLLQPLLFWNPAFALFRRRLGVLRELICDAALLKRPSFSKRRYCETLISVARSMSKARHSANALAVPFVEPKRHLARRGQSSLEYRILYALELPSAHRSIKGGNWGILLPLCLALLLVLVLLQRPSEWSHDRIMLSTIVNLEHLQTLNGGN
ncbi:M56 family metallopeptidase [Maritalea mediterranea]|uniref:M56 family metallopeptidase n=1 Tax=Maritalea mediterranea TaxID=2909667 RepID=A0ABS9E6H9_9HYPH|nr:M56 family metallopeptidase [Maritalea mediterranea]MCF4098472.1 M56 family metallopeptidase [Maritalea mediterranea]